MSTDRLNRIIEEGKSLTPEDRRRFLERLERDEESSTSETPARHALIWYVDQHQQLSSASQAVISDPANELLLSAGSI